MEHNLHSITDQNTHIDTFRILCGETEVAKKEFKRSAHPEEVNEWVRHQMDEHRKTCQEGLEDE